MSHVEVRVASFLAELGDGGVYRSHEGMRQYASDLRDACEVFQAEVEDTVVVGDAVLLLSRLRYRGNGSGVDATSPAAHIVKFRGGRTVYMRSFRDQEEALEAAGLWG